MRLSDLVSGLSIIEQHGSPDVAIDSIVYDSRKARQGSLFVCIEGYVTDGHQYIRQAIEQNVSALLVQKEVPDLPIPWVKVADTRKGLAHVSDRFFDHPSGKLDLIGITGTKGKTTSTYMAKAILQAAGRRAGLIGTIANVLVDQVRFASRTTPESYDLQALLAEMLQHDLDSCVMEVSSQGLMLDRVYGCEYATGAFTNLYHDHIGPHEHASMEEYLQAKLLLFDRCRHAVINRDSDCYEQVRAAVRGSCVTFGLGENADIRATHLEKTIENGRMGTRFQLESPEMNGSIFVGMPGRFNVYNALTAIACTLPCGVCLPDLQQGLSRIVVPGRLQPVPSQLPFQVVVDYAHNAASLESVLRTLREYAVGRLVVVFGCGGDRARSRRFEMAKVSGTLADLSIITSDNPRSEKPEAIIEDIVGSMKKTGGDYQVEPDRTSAIALAVDQAREGDMIVIAGKGHETYQIFKDETIHFDDAEVAAAIMAKKEGDERGKTQA